MDSSVGRGAPAWVVTARDLYLVAMAVFVVNIVIGILNGADAVEFDRNQILTHVHAGTVGWLTLAIVASTFVLFQAADRRLMLALAVLVPVYVARLLHRQLRVPGDRRRGPARSPSRGCSSGSGRRTSPASGRCRVWPSSSGLTTFGYGALIGVLLQVGFAAGMTIVPGNAVGAHASAMTFGYLVLVGDGASSNGGSSARGTCRRSASSRSSRCSSVASIISVSLLIGAEQAGGGIYLLTQLDRGRAVRGPRSGRARCASSWADGRADPPLRDRRRSGSSARW